MPLNTANLGFEKKIWGAADTLRGNLDAAEYKHVVLGLIFLKYISDSFEEKYKELVEEGAGFEEEKDEYLADNIFYVPEKARWGYIAKHANKPEIGQVIDTAMVEIERENNRLKGILPKNFARPELDKRRLGEVVDIFTNIPLSDYKGKKDILGRTYEYCLAMFAEQEGRRAGEFYTPSSIVRTLVEILEPYNGRVYDPACGTGGFFLASYDYISQSHDLNRDEKEFLKNKTFYGNEIVANTRRLCLMNMFLHNIGEIDGESFISSADALIADEGNRYDYVLANPPFGKKSSMTITNEEGEQVKEDLVYNRQDFWVTTSNKQLNFLQHIRTLLKENGQAAVVLPDNVLFEGGAGETVRKELLKTTELHTILRLPTGIFYRPGVKANVLFFDNRPGARDPWTKEVWFYDYRTNIHHTLKKKPMQFEDLEDFIKCYNPSNRHDRRETWSEENPEGRWRKYSYDEIIERDKTSLDIFWLKDDSLTDLENLPDPDILANEIIENIEAGLESFQALMETLNGE